MLADDDLPEIVTLVSNQSDFRIISYDRVYMYVQKSSVTSGYGTVN
jgi:hypothetical protein